MNLNSVNSINVMCLKRLTCVSSNQLHGQHKVAFMTSSELFRTCRCRVLFLFFIFLEPGNSHCKMWINPRGGYGGRMLMNRKGCE